MANWYCSSVAYTAVAQFAITTAYSIGNIVRQLAAPAVNSERCFRCTTAGTSGGSEAAWNLTKGATTTQGTAIFTEVTGNETWQGTSWAAPFARITTAISGAWTAAGDTTYVSSDHAETQTTSLTATAASSAPNNPNRIICVTRPSASIPPASTDLATTATVTTTTTGVITLNGSLYCYGVTFNSGSGAAGNVNFSLDAGGNWQMFERCTLAMLSTNGIERLVFGTGGSISTGAATILRNTNITFGGANHGLQIFKRLIWDGGTLGGFSITTLVGTAASDVKFCQVDIRNVDLSIIGAACFLANLTNLSLPNVAVSFTNCKVSASLGGVVTGTIANPGDTGVDFVISDSGTVTLREEHYSYPGSVIQDTTNYRTGGASDGTTTKAWKMVSNANCKYTQALLAPDIVQWVNSTGSVTFTMFIANTSATLKDNECGFDIEYMGSGSTPLGTLDTSFSNVLAAGANLTTDTSTWNGLASPTIQKVTKTITLNEKGWVRITPRLAKASATVWIDPYVSAGGQVSNRQYIGGPNLFINEGVSTSVAGSLLTHPGMAGGMRG